MTTELPRGLDYSQVWKLMPPEKALKNFKASGVLVISTDNERILLGRNSETGLWGNFAGKRKDSETPVETAIREAEEEMGIRFDPNELGKPLIMVAVNGSKISSDNLEVGICYPVVADLHVHSATVGGELSEVEWFDFERVMDLTDAFMETDVLWGGAWTEMAVMRWAEKVRCCNTAGLFSGAIAFSKILDREKQSPYRSNKRKEYK